MFSAHRFILLSSRKITLISGHSSSKQLSYTYIIYYLHIFVVKKRIAVSWKAGVEAVNSNHTAEQL